MPWHIDYIHWLKIYEYQLSARYVTSFRYVTGLKYKKVQSEINMAI